MKVRYFIIINYSFTKEGYDIGIKYLKEVYGAKIMTSDELIEFFNK